MPDDWAEKYIDVHRQKQQEKQRKEQEVQKRQQLVEVGGPELFHKIRERMQWDVQTLHGVVAFQAVEVEAMQPSGKFRVIYRSSPRATLDVHFNAPLVTYEYMFSSKEGTGKFSPERKPGTLRICSDLDGRLTVYKNGSTEAFTDESNVSEFLLKPLFDRIDN